jgi:hypothetical protein
MDCGTRTEPSRSGRRAVAKSAPPHSWEHFAEGSRTMTEEFGEETPSLEWDVYINGIDARISQDVGTMWLLLLRWEEFAHEVGITEAGLPLLTDTRALIARVLGEGDTE